MKQAAYLLALAILAFAGNARAEEKLNPVAVESFDCVYVTREIWVTVCDYGRFNQERELIFFVRPGEICIRPATEIRILMAGDEFLLSWLDRTAHQDVELLIRVRAIRWIICDYERTAYDDPEIAWWMTAGFVTGQLAGGAP